MVKTPIDNINNPQGAWFKNSLQQVQKKKPFLIISTMVYLANFVTPGHQIKAKILQLIQDNPQMQIHKLGFTNNWNQEPLWK